MKGYLLDNEFMVDVHSFNADVLLDELEKKVKHNYGRCLGNKKQCQQIYIGKTSVEEGAKKFNASDPKKWRKDSIKNTWAHGKIASKSMIVISTAITDAVVPQRLADFETWKEKKGIAASEDRKKEDIYASFLEDTLIERCRSCDQFIILNDIHYHPGSIAVGAVGSVLYMKFQFVRL